MLGRFARIFTCLCVRGTDAEFSDEKACACIRKEEEGFSEAGFSDDDPVLSASCSSGHAPVYSVRRGTGTTEA